MLEPLLIFFGFSALGLAAMAPAVTFGDAGEFTACAAGWGIAHAPGYPLYTILGKALGTALPLGNWAYRTNLLSCLAAAAALALVGDALRLAGFARTPRLGALAALGLCPLLRTESGVTEVFALHVLALSVLLWLVCRFAGRFWEDRPMAAFGLCCGLGLGNHQTLILAVPAALLEGAMTSPASPRRIARGLGVCAGFGVLGLLIYLCLPLRSVHGPALDWGHPVDLPRFLHVFLRKDYGSLSLTVEGHQTSAGFLNGVLAQLQRFFMTSARGLGWPVMLLALAGLGVWRRCAIGVSLWFPVSWILLTGPFFLCLGNPPFDAQTSGALERFYLAPWICITVLAAAALQRLMREGPGAARLVAAALAILLAVPGALSADWIERGDYAAYDYGRGVMNSLPPGASLFMDGGDDTFYALAFLDFAEGRRADLDLHDRGGLVFPNPYGTDFRRLDEQAKEARRREIESVIAGQDRLYYSTLKESIVEGYDLRPWGLLKKAQRKGSEAEGQDLWELYPTRWTRTLLRAHYRDRALVAVYPVMRAADLQSRGQTAEAVEILRQAWLMAGDALWLKGTEGYMLGLAGYTASARKDWPLALKSLSFAHQIEPDRTEILLNLGVVYEKSGQEEQAERIYREAAAQDPQASQPYFNLGAMYWAKSRWREAAEAFETGLLRRPGDQSLARWAAAARRKAAGS
jgi:tetratricopeptide (TPR) repeat protein